MLSKKNHIILQVLIPLMSQGWRNNLFYPLSAAASTFSSPLRPGGKKEKRRSAELEQEREHGMLLAKGALKARARGGTNPFSLLSTG